jgi:GST-like protein
MITLYAAGTPNGQKIAIMLRELDVPFDVRLLKLGDGEQRDPAFLAINPNGKIPAITDTLETGQRIRVFESGAILVYLAEKHGRLLPAAGDERYEALAWTFWQVGGLGPMLGQWLHFSRAAPEPNPYASERYRTECLRLLGVLDGRLQQVACLAGTYSIADIACFPWAAAAFRLLGADTPDLGERFPHASRWLDTLSERDAVRQGLRLGAVA